MEITLKQIAAWTGGTVSRQFEDLKVTGFTTDSRNVKVGQMFVALVGERFDGHNFINDVIRVCTAVLTQKEVAPDIPAVYVADTLKAYGAIAAGYKASLSIKTIGITGSVGKTTTKEMTAAVMGASFQTVKTPANHNNHIGLPETILSIGENAEVAVVEMGMNHFGEISYLTNIAKPDVAIITNIGSMHIENLGSREGILKAKTEIFEGLGPDGVVILNGDDTMLWGLKKTLPFKALYYGIQNEACDYRAEEIQSGDDQVSFTLNAGDMSFRIVLPTPGRHNIPGALAAAAAGLLFGIKPEAIAAALAGYENTGFRQKTIEYNGATLIADCYNAGPESMEAALTMLKEHSCMGKRIAVLADMLELGNHSVAEHFKVGRIAARCVDMVFACGEKSHRIAEGAVTGGLSNNVVFYFETPEQMARMLKSRVRKGDLVLFKASHGMHLERVIEMFMNGNKT